MKRLRLAWLRWRWKRAYKRDRVKPLEILTDKEDS